MRWPVSGSAYSFMKMSFNDYLKGLEMSRLSMITCERSVSYYLGWLKKQSIDQDQAGYADILAYMKHCQRNGVTQRTVQNYLNMIRHFYNYRIAQKAVASNPVSGIRVQGVKRKSLYYIFKPEQLHAIYNACRSETLMQRQDKVMLGLLVYQGLKVEDINRLDVAHVKLKEGKLEVPGSRKTSPRTLTLESFQVLELYDFVKEVRRQIVDQSGEQTEKLFVGVTGTVNMNNHVGRLLRELRGQFAAIKNAKQIRASVITKWLVFYNLRQVQYLAGHRYISSTESYQQNEMEGLTEEVNRFHPLG